MSKLITSEEAAVELGVSDGHVRQLCIDGRIEGAQRIGWAWMIPSPIKYVERRKVGRPRKEEHYSTCVGAECSRASCRCKCHGEETTE